MAKKTQYVVGLDLGTENCTLVALNAQKKQIEIVGRTQIQPSWRSGNLEFGAGIHSWLVELKLDKGVKAVAACLSGTRSMLQLVEIDNALSVEDAIRFEARTWLGTSDDELVINGLPQGTGAHDQPAHLIAASPRKLVSALRSTMDAASLPLTEVGIDIVAAANAFEANYPSWIDRLVAVVLADARSLQILWTQDGKFMGHGILPAQSANPADELSLEGAKALQAGLGLVKGAASDLSGVFLCGELSRANGFASRLGSGLRADVHLLDSFASVSFPSAESVSEQLSEISPRCATALGLALSLSQGDRP
jgi:Tfp pilus assembly PilM family ATPase